MLFKNIINRSRTIMGVKRVSLCLSFEIKIRYFFLIRVIFF